MIHAYNDKYINDVMKNLGAFFDIAINDLNYKPNLIADMFVSSDIANAIENGVPNYLSGKSATEMLSELLKENINIVNVPQDRTPEYWAGWILAYTQWYLNKSFKDILQTLSFEMLISMYYPYHEAPESKTVNYIQELFPKVSALKAIRKMRKLSQKELSTLSGVKLRSIQCYEQGDIDIRSAGAETVYALAKTLDCTVEDLIK